TSLAPVPINVIGELYIGGHGLARGYLNRPELTQEKFIENPFASEEDKKSGKNLRLYKTGDLCRWLPDGNIEYIGRTDDQVKIRGFRIELGEIESTLLHHLQIKETVVLVREESPGDKRLVAYVVFKGDSINTEELRSYLQENLPDYMIPSAFVILDKIPLTSNGKIDKKALPAPEYQGDEKNYVAPRTKIEKVLCEIWQSVLNIEKVGIRDDFFRLGGDSIVSIQLVSRLRQRLGLTVSIKDIFIYKSIEQLYDHVLSKEIKNNHGTLVLKTEQGLLSGNVSLLPIQEWFFKNKFTQPSHWNQSFLVKTPSLDLEKLQECVHKLVEYHDSFRLRYKKTGILQKGKSKEYTQFYDSSAQLEALKVLDIRSLKPKEGSNEFKAELQAILTQWQSGFDLSEGPIYSLGYLYGYKDGSARVHFALHHLIVDAVSWRILTEDLRALYEGSDLNALKGSSYRQWVEAVRNYDKNHEDELPYWKTVLSDYETEKFNHLIICEDTRNLTNLVLNHDQTHKLLRESNKAYHTQINDLLLTALGLTLSEITKSQVNHITLEGHGREELDSRIDITRTLGWFTTMFPVRLEIEKDIGKSIKIIKESLRKIPNKGIGYGSLCGYTTKALPRISFNYLGQFNNAEELTDTWSISEESSGAPIHPANHDTNILNINGLVLEGRLQFSISSKLDEHITKKAAKLFKQKLEEVISHTVNQKRSYLTASDIDNIISQAHLDRLQEVREIANIYKANSLQQGFIYHALHQGDVDDAYRVQLIWKYNNTLEVNKLREAWSYAQKKYPSLRLRFAWEEELVQVIDKIGHVDWRYIDLSNDTDLTMQKLKVKQIQEGDRCEPYNLAHGNLFRIYLIKHQEASYTCIFSNHHAILDGWSNPILLEYVHDTYLKLCNRKTVSILGDHSYEDAQKYLQEHGEEHKEYWEQYVSRLEERGDLSGLFKKEGGNLRLSDYKHVKCPVEQTLIIKEKIYESIKSLSQEAGVTLNAVLTYAWHKALSLYGNSQQTVVGTTVSGRNLPIDNIETSVGLYINTLPLIVDHQRQSKKSLLEAIKDIQSNLNEINSRSNTSLAKLQRNGERLFDSLFVYENYPSPMNEESLNRIRISFQEAVEKLDYPLVVIAYEANNAVTFKLKYADELFDKKTMEHLLLLIKVFLEQIARTPHQETQNLSYLNAKQYQQIIQTWNETEKDYPSHKTIQKLFEEQVERTPDNVAIVYEDVEITYRQLNEKANQLANYIRQTHEIKSDTLIILCLDRNEHMLIGILAVLKAGGAYVPMDPNYPDERIQYILEDTNTQIVLTNEIYKGRLENISKTKLMNTGMQQQLDILAIDHSILQAKLSSRATSNLMTSTISAHLAYVIYTSGTTGKPKGVMIEHKSFVATINCIKQLYFTDEQRINTYSITNYVFDIFGLEYGLPLLNGGIISMGTHDFNLLECSNYDFIQMTPSLCDLKLDFLVNTLHLKLFVGGEKASKVLLDKGLNKFKSVVNFYGPTETTIWSASKIYYSKKDKSILCGSFGKPFNNETAYVLDCAQMPLPIGATGELYIGGVGLARGYLNRPDLTAEKFIPNPFQTEKEKKEKKNSRLYKTGDLVRWLPDGNLEYIGRNDSQVKIRGHRIEPTEVESILSDYEGIKQSIVLVKEHKDGEEKLERKYLVGYYVSKEKLDEEKIYHYLQTKLPEYMIPSFFVHLEKLPLTINGKLDKKALPDPELIREESYVGPRNEVEKQMCQIWAEVLNIDEDKISIRDNFFRLGGNSILAIK
ncbi:MAG: amino acid adenylation domain-containing protein, partial [Candidatus Pacebacteria bacterium]|nr:amino acid adenylation domain-containing protein [Candidatus Paceibacterota bacterium]